MNHLKPIITPDSKPLTQEEIEKRKRLEKRSKEIGWESKFNHSEHENPYRAEAMLYILKDMDVPKELKGKIKAEDERYSSTFITTKNHKASRRK